MIGKMQDMVTAAVVVSATENKSGYHANKGMQSENNGQSVHGALSIENAGTTPLEPIDLISAVPEANQSSEEQAKEKQDEKLSPEFVSEMTRELNELMGKLNCDLEFTYHQEVDVMSVKMIDKNTKEVIKEYPPEDMVEGMIKAQEWLGAFLDKKA